MMRSHHWLATALVLISGAAFAQAPAIKITRQPSIIYMPTYVMEQRHLVEAHAAALGASPLRVEWLTFAGGGSATDAMLAGAIDVVNTGPGNLLLLWDRTKEGVKGIAASSALPLVLVTRDPRIKTLADFGPTDKIAVPTVRVSTQAVLLQIASATQFGAQDWAHMDGNEVQMSHPDAAVALSNPRHEVASHFSAPPFVFQELRQGAHVVIANPLLIRAIKDATIEAAGFIHDHPRDAIEIYRAGSGDKTPTDDLLVMMQTPGMDDYQAKPQGTFRTAQHMFRIGTLKTEPQAWTDYFFPMSHDLDGN